MLEDLAKLRQVSSSEVVRTLVRDAYKGQFAAKNPGAEILPTPRALFEAVTRVSHPQHLTVKNIAGLADVAPSAVKALFRRLEREGFFSGVASHPGGDETWESSVPLKELLREAEKKGVRLDTPIEQNALSLDVYIRDRVKGVIGIGPIGASAERSMAGLADTIRSICRKIVDHHEGKVVSTQEIASQLATDLAAKLGRAVDAYSSAGRVHLATFHIEA